MYSKRSSKKDSRSIPGYIQNELKEGHSADERRGPQRQPGECSTRAEVRPKSEDLVVWRELRKESSADRPRSQQHYGEQSVRGRQKLNPEDLNGGRSAAKVQTQDSPALEMIQRSPATHQPRGGHETDQPLGRTDPDGDSDGGEERYSKSPTCNCVITIVGGVVFVLMLIIFICRLMEFLLNIRNLAGAMLWLEGTGDNSHALPPINIGATPRQVQM